MRVVELFAGAGGMSLGLTQAGMTILRAYEFEEAMLRVYRKNLQNPIQRFSRRDHAHQYDLNNFRDIAPSISDLSPDLIVGGPPCQDFSSAGDRIEGPRAKLTAYYAQMVCIVRPEWVIFENVSQALRAKQYAIAKKLLKKAGYGLSENIVYASQYGVPQMRKRLILVGRLGEQDGFLDAAILAKAAKEHMTIRDAFGDRFGERTYFHARAKDRRSIWKASEPAPTIRASSGRPGKRLRGVVEEFYDPSVEELALFQGFPETWDWSGETKGNIGTMIGNAVPPPLARTLGEVILDRHFGRSIPAIPNDFSAWLSDKGYSPPSIRNVRSRINAGRRLLRGRTFAVPSHEVGALEEVIETAGLTVKAASDIRIAMRLLREFEAPNVTPALRAPTEFDEVRIAHRRRTAHLPSSTRYQPDEHLDPYDDVVEAV